MPHNKAFSRLSQCAPYLMWLGLVSPYEPCIVWTSEDPWKRAYVCWYKRKEWQKEFTCKQCRGTKQTRFNPGVRCWKPRPIKSFCQRCSQPGAAPFWQIQVKLKKLKKLVLFSSLLYILTSTCSLPVQYTKKQSPSVRRSTTMQLCNVIIKVPTRPHTNTDSVV